MIHIASITRFQATIAVIGSRTDLAALVRAGSNSRMLGMLRQCFLGLSLWITMPLAIWLSSGWLGLLILFQAFLSAASLHSIEIQRSNLRTARVKSFAGAEILEGEASCALIKPETT
jgi:hypothetical protein